MTCSAETSQHISPPSTKNTFAWSDASSSSLRPLLCLARSLMTTNKLHQILHNAKVCSSHNRYSHSRVSKSNCQCVTKRISFTNLFVIDHGGFKGIPVPFLRSVIV